MLTFASIMKTYFQKEMTEILSPCVATIGFFDGVHLGHRHVIGLLKQLAWREGLPSAVVTFEHHPRQVLQSQWRPRLLSTLDEKIHLLSLTGIDRLVVLSFDEAMAALSARHFMHDILYSQLGVRTLLTGYDNHFGHRTAGSSEGIKDYVVYGQEMGMLVVQGTPYIMDNGLQVSSSKVRHLIQDGHVEDAAKCLGRPFAITGRVVSGEHIGATLGYPTANLQLQDADKLVPAPGVYAVTVSAGQPENLQHSAAVEELPGMMNIGSRPTFGGDHQTLETHILHFTGNVYGRVLTVRFISRLRSEKCFDSAESLAAQLAADARMAEKAVNEKSRVDGGCMDFLGK